MHIAREHGSVHELPLIPKLAKYYMLGVTLKPS